MLPALQPAEGGRDASACSPACSPAASTSALGRAAGTDPLTDARPAARPPPGRARRLPHTARRAAGATSRTACPPTTRSRGWPPLPGPPETPEPWLLGSSPQSAVWAAELGLPYAFADFINPGGAAIAAAYRERFERVGRAPAPRVAVGGLGRLRRHRRGGAAPGVQRPDDAHAAAPRPAHPRAAGRGGAALPGGRGAEGAGGGGRAAAAAAQSSARRRRCARGWSRSPATTAPRRSSSSRSPTTTTPGGAPTSCSPRPSPSSRGPRASWRPDRRPWRRLSAQASCSPCWRGSSPRSSASAARSPSSSGGAGGRRRRGADLVLGRRALPRHAGDERGPEPAPPHPGHHGLVDARRGADRRLQRHTASRPRRGPSSSPRS